MNESQLQNAVKTAAKHLGFEGRFWSKVDKSSDGCWLWTGGRSKAGYGTFNMGGGREDCTYDYAHRVSYRLLRGEIPTGAYLHHSCEVRHCVNPDHLTPLLQDEHMRRHHPTCRRGHLMSGANLYTSPHGARSCRECKRIRRAGGAK